MLHPKTVKRKFPPQTEFIPYPTRSHELAPKKTKSSSIQSVTKDVIWDLIDNNDSSKIISHLMKGNIGTLRDKHGNSPLIRAAFHSNLELMDLLLRLGDSNIADKNDMGFSALMYSAMEGSMPCTQLCISNRANVNDCDDSKVTALMLACYNNHLEIARLLLSKGADPNMLDQIGSTALIDAAGKGNVALVELLLDHHANVDITNTDGYTALFRAAANGHGSCVQLLHARGAGINAVNDLRETPLIVAIKRKHVDVINFLVKRANTNLCDRSGNTALIYATLDGNSSLVQQLIESHADANFRNKEGINPILISALKMNIPLIELLKSRGAKTHYLYTFHRRQYDIHELLCLNGHQEFADKIFSDLSK